MMHEYPDPWTIRRATALFARACRLRCPACGGGPLFVSWLRMCPNCPQCGLGLEREPGYQVGSYMFNLITAQSVYAVVLGVLLLLTWPDPPWAVLTWAGVAGMLVFPVLFYPLSKTLFLALDLFVRPLEPEDLELPHEPAGQRIANSE
jgi:uncharacterized protein (DUF983 family)